jgi:hypothetical protein
MIRKRAVKTTQQYDRRGAVVGLLLMGLVFLTGFAALAVNVAKLQHVQTQLRAACRSAALAGAAELLDEGCLYGAPTQADDVWSAREAARFYAARNIVEGLPLQLDANLKNDPKGDLVVGWIDPAGPVGQLLQLPTDSHPLEVNTVRVTARMGRNVADRVTLWFGGLVGLSSFDIAAQAQASIDRRIVGFKPEPGVKVPLVPLVADYEDWCTAATVKADPEVNDLYFVNPLTETVTAGADGIPEMTLICGNTTSTAGIPCAPLALLDPLNLSYISSVRCREGLSADDLQGYGGQLVIGPGGCPVSIEKNLPEDLPYGLMDIVGRARAWPLGAPGTQSGSVNLIGFGAARIVAVRPVDNSQNNAWEIVVQPTTLACSQAVAVPGAVPNPWIAKLELTQ